MDSVDLVQSVATAIGVGIAAFQLRDGARQRRAAFEQGLIGRYQEVQSGSTFGTYSTTPEVDAG